jgi:predicted ABC-type ATPase
MDRESELELVRRLRAGDTTAFDVVYGRFNARLFTFLARLMRSRERAEDLRVSEYDVQLVFLWLPSADFAVARVADRVRSGGHNVPEETVRRRYQAGLRNLFSLYVPLASAWGLYDGSTPAPRLVAEGLETQPPKVYDDGVWGVVRREGTA